MKSSFSYKSIIKGLLKINYLAAAIVLVVNIAGSLSIIRNHFSANPIRDMLLIFGPALAVSLSGAVYFYISKNLYEIYRSIAEKNPFSKENGLKLRRSAYVLIFYMAHSISNYFFINPVLKTFFNAHLKYQPNFNFNFLTITFFIILLLTISEVFIQGAKLKEEQDLTI